MSVKLSFFPRLAVQFIWCCPLNNRLNWSSLMCIENINHFSQPLMSQIKKFVNCHVLFFMLIQQSSIAFDLEQITIVVCFFRVLFITRIQLSVCNSVEVPFLGPRKGKMAQFHISRTIYHMSLVDP